LQGDLHDELNAAPAQKPMNSHPVTKYACLGNWGYRAGAVAFGAHFGVGYRH